MSCRGGSRYHVEKEPEPSHEGRLDDSFQCDAIVHDTSTSFASHETDRDGGRSVETKSQNLSHIRNSGQNDNGQRGVHGERACTPKP